VWNTPHVTRPTNYAYSFGGGWYTDLFPAGTAGYQSSWSYPPLYAWQYETTPIYQWDTSSPYNTTSWGSDVWAWQGALSSSQSYVTGGGIPMIQQPPLLLDADVGVGVVQDYQPAAPVIEAPQSLEQRRAESRLLSRINRTYDVAPDFGAAIEGTVAGDYSAAIYAMRRAAGVNPLGIAGSGSRVKQSIREDRDFAQRAAFARQVFENPPQRIVSEADANFMVGALCAAMGESESAEQYLSAAQAAGDGAISTELLRRAVRGESLDPSGPWVPGRPLVK
jgi:hypothetical protein